MYRIVAAALFFGCWCAHSGLSADSGEPDRPVWRVLEPGRRPADSRLGELRRLRDEYHPWSPATDKQAWPQQAESIRRRVLVSTGLWPMPPKPSLQPTIHGKIDRGDYTIEKVFFASHPGHYVCGNLYRPAKIKGKAPGVLCPHGHWRNGRFYDAGQEKARAQIDKGAEKFMSAARFPVQARMVQLARLGCVVFHYDMVGYADSRQIDHSAGFTDAEAGLRLQNFMGLQTFNSIRALDFLVSLPEVDPQRVAVTGSSGGGTQTFMLCAVDSRLAAAFPAVMVSTNMQGGCVCENASYLRHGINNVAIAALFAPKPLAMSGADDWTIDIETKGLPELKQVYSFFGNTDHVHATAYPQFGHNYNRVARTMMYEWFNEHLRLGQEQAIEEQDFWPVMPEELSVFDEQHPRPDDAGSAADLRRYLTEAARDQYRALLPTDADELDEYKRVVGAGARIMLGEGVPSPDEMEANVVASEQLETDITLLKGTTGRRGAGEQVPWVGLLPATFNGTAVLWLDDRGNAHLFDKAGSPAPGVRKLLEAGHAVFSADLFMTGEYLPDGALPQKTQVDQRYHGYTFGYNRPLLSNRVRDILTAIGGLVQNNDVRRLHLVGTGAAGPWTLLARALAGDAVEQTLVDIGGFRFASVESTSDSMFLPGALKYGGLGGLAALAAPAKLTVAGISSSSPDEMEPLQAAYSAIDAEERLTVEHEPLEGEVVAQTLLE